MNIAINGPIYIYNDKQSVLSNIIFPEHKLTKKHQDVSYHIVKEGVAKN